MNGRYRAALAAGGLAAGLISMTSQAANLPDGYWRPEQVKPILSKTVTVHLAPDLSGLSPAERAAVQDLLEAGRLLHRIYLEQTHRASLTAKARLEKLNDQLDQPPATRDLLKLFWMFKGPIATTLDNEREPFLPVEPQPPGRNVYPWNIARATLDQYLAAHPRQRDALLAPRTIVREVTADNIAADQATLKQYPALATLHPDFVHRLSALDADRGAYYAVPYSVAYADDIVRAYHLLWHAADAIEASDPDFADYLRNRGRDLLSDNYESGDAAWVTGDFKTLNAQIGSFETYDDKLYGVKTFFSLSLLLKDRQRSAAVKKALKHLQAIENNLPYEHHKQVITDIPVGVYNVIADFGQARGTNTASILPNDPRHAEKYGRTILLRYNIMTNPALFADSEAAWKAAVVEADQDDLTMDGGFQRTLWHEIGHYLGVAQTVDGRNLNAALAPNGNLFEEMKADLVSLFAAPELHKAGYYNDAALRAVYAAGVERTLQTVKPRRDQPYQTMELMQMNYFLRHGLLSFDRDSGRLAIHYGKYHEVVTDMLRDVLAIQYAGNPDRAAAFIDEYATWDDDVQGVIAKHIRAATQYRYALVKYAALQDQ